MNNTEFLNNLIVRLEVIKELNFYDLKDEVKKELLECLLKAAMEHCPVEEVLNLDAIELKFILVKFHHPQNSVQFILCLGKVMFEQDEHIAFIPPEPFNKGAVSIFIKGGIDYIKSKLDAVFGLEKRLPLPTYMMN